MYTAIKLSVEEVLEFQWSEIADLMRRDPITCSRYFDHCSKELFNARLRTLRSTRRFVDIVFYCIFRQLYMLSSRENFI